MHAMLRSVVGGMALALFAWPPTGGTGGDPAPQGQGSSGDAIVAEQWPAIRALHRDLLQRTGIAGSSLVMIVDGRVVARSEQGYQDLDRKRPVDERTIYHWASITKTLTGIAIVQLRDRGRLRLDDPVVVHLPEIRQIHNPFGDISQVTIRHVMSHSAGLRAATWPWGGDKAWQPFEPTRWEQLVAMMPYTELQFAPGSRYSYSNPGIILLGRIIEQLAGEDFEVYVAKNILMPLEMRQAFFDRAPYHLLPYRSHSYFRDPGGLREARFDFDTGITVSNGGLNAPLDDMARYLAFLIGPPPGSVADAVLSRASLEEMFTPIVTARDGEGGTGDDVRMGLSFFVERHKGLEFVAHSGGQNGFISHFYLHRPTRSAYVVAFNTEVRSGGSPVREITREADAELRDALIERVFARLSKAPRR
jgi:CubicO group peptidase (beta-lactamase class C family)